jgi:hypothetical protein
MVWLSIRAFPASSKACPAPVPGGYLMAIRLHWPLIVTATAQVRSSNLTLTGSACLAKIGDGIILATRNKDRNGYRNFENVECRSRLRVHCIRLRQSGGEEVSGTI